MGWLISRENVLFLLLISLHPLHLGLKLDVPQEGSPVPFTVAITEATDVGEMLGASCSVC